MQRNLWSTQHAINVSDLFLLKSRTMDVVITVEKVLAPYAGRRSGGTPTEPGTTKTGTTFHRMRPIQERPSLERPGLDSDHDWKMGHESIDRISYQEI
jgi:hypothetical protein